uniref:MRN complex-interacting protein N-terminal domain-containing protein n=1 Tax=Arundo donax TaxID=35708 RepID=A0A0A9GHR1_ARUDO
MASATLFLALQCVQCATMQVKQQKKSSNKWVCAVCNQRQSVMRVHARGHRAADLRRFVQDANMSRGGREYAPLAEAVAAEEERDEVPREERRTDWSEYLDDPLEQRHGLGGVDGETDTRIEVTTELPQERPKIRPRKAQLGVAEKRPKPSTNPNPTLSKRQQIEQVSSPCSATATATAEAQRSKWSKYLDLIFCGEGNGSEISGQHWTETDQYATTEVVVDDKVHPDFI